MTSDGKSQEHQLPHGAPQGSVLSLTLFHAVMAQLVRFLPSFLHFSTYGDDSFL